MISLLVAHDPDRVIGKDNQLPWHIPEDLAYFKRVSMGKGIVMGRKTFESIGRPLPGRLNIVVTRNRDFQADGVTVVHTLNEAIEKSKAYHEEVVIIGGAEIFRLAIGIADRMYITFIQQHFEGDTFFPPYGDEWKLTSVSEDLQSADGTVYSFLVYEKKPN